MPGDTATNSDEILHEQVPKGPSVKARFRRFGQLVAAASESRVLQDRGVCSEASRICPRPGDL
jgi:hypothetical protein